MYYKLLIFILVNAGVAISATRSTLTHPIRKFIEERSKWWGSLVGCPMCAGFYTSIPIYFFVYDTSKINLTLLAFMFIGSFTAYFLNRISNIG